MHLTRLEASKPAFQIKQDLRHGKAGVPRGNRWLGGAPCLFWVAISLDLVGLSLLLIGIFANVQVSGRGVGDCFVYTGAIIIFFSLIWWLSWCTGNIEVSLEELEKGAVVRENSLAKLTRKFSERLAVKKHISPAEDSKQNKKGVGELSTANGRDVGREWGEVWPQQRQEPRYVELSNVRRPREQQSGERLL
ncbi:transmembrane protein 238-like [Pristis pectinata]|uniref:transmembrane protein 238-like n=1 Tax=Pristis pectinata TaxID=685728 RepID=UPI00223D3BDF|nr:transmembrane protein 238-like [Pristis pectinata]